MSALTPCNWCTLQGIRRRADDRGAAVTLGPAADLPGWIAVTVSDRPEPAAWFMALGEHCECAA